MQYPNYYQNHQQVCPTCGHCPTCGQKRNTYQGILGGGGIGAPNGLGSITVNNPPNGAALEQTIK